MKIFGIGCNKTGTTTLGYCLRLLGFGPHADWDNSNWLIIEWAHGNYRPILEFAKSYQSFDDGPWNYTDVYQHLDRTFPGSKFILTIRDPDNWFDSWCRFHNGDLRRLGTLAIPYHRIAFGLEEGYCFDHLGDQYKKRYQERNQQVRTYFKNRSDDLLIIDWEKGDGWEQLCQFLQVPIPDIPFPWLNKSRTPEDDLAPA